MDLVGFLIRQRRARAKAESGKNDNASTALFPRGGLGQVDMKLWRVVKGKSSGELSSTALSPSCGSGFDEKPCLPIVTAV